MSVTPVGVHQVLVGASPGDAITGVARWLRTILRRSGPSEIFALHIDQAVEHDIKHIAAYRPRQGRSVLIFHASIGEPAILEFLRARREPLVLVYHNVTPAKYFEPYDPRYAQLLEYGRYEVAQLRPRVSVAVADSAYNAAELGAMGYRDVRIAPPIGDIRRLSTVASDPATEAWMAQLEHPILLSVAQLMPHKRPDFLVEALHIAQTYQGLRGTTLMVGHHRLERYARAVRTQARELNLERVHLTGPVSDGQLAAMYRAADAFISTSEHEGFCLPVVEAMTFDVPVLARGCAAVPETVADAGLLLPEHAGPTMLAEAIGELLGNDPVRTRLQKRGQARLDAFDAMKPENVMLDAVLAVA
jgi:glycosyltransferase involved in cell wall biosynthesis